jgi:hypothetical protein
VVLPLALVIVSSLSIVLCYVVFSLKLLDIDEITPAFV